MEKLNLQSARDSITDVGGADTGIRSFDILIVIIFMIDQNIFLMCCPRIHTAVSEETMFIASTVHC